MAYEQELAQRSGSKCEICSSQDGLSTYEVPYAPQTGPDGCLYVCETCLEQFNDMQNLNVKHFYCLQDSMWSEHAAVQVMAYRLLHQLRADGFAQGLLDQLYLDEDRLKWAEAGILRADENIVPTKDSNGTQLLDGDSVTLIKDLEVKGAGFTAKRGTMVKNISLTEDPKLIEGKVGGQQIVLVAAYLKKA